MWWISKFLVQLGQNARGDDDIKTLETYVSQIYRTISFDFWLFFCCC